MRASARLVAQICDFVPVEGEIPDPFWRQVVRLLPPRGSPGLDALSSSLKAAACAALPNIPAEKILEDPAVFEEKAVMAREVVSEIRNALMPNSKLALTEKNFTSLKTYVFATLKQLSTTQKTSRKELRVSKVEGAPRRSQILENAATNVRKIADRVRHPRFKDPKIVTLANASNAMNPRNPSRFRSAKERDRQFAAIKGDELHKAKEAETTTESDRILCEISTAPRRSRKRR